MNTHSNLEIIRVYIGTVLYIFSHQSTVNTEVNLKS